ncbi:hypothetical protein G9P44_002056 [Scheffersomyces stipitis]|nr:hypothetical protein G9P44_002056 [Scheffersomyces stipitis]
MSHHTPTPAPTPIKAHNHHSKKLPLIVDIAIDDNGKQLYQVHESSKSVRREMPHSANFSNSFHTDESSIFVKHEERTPVRRVLGTLSPTTLNSKKLEEHQTEFEDDSVSSDRKLTSAASEYIATSEAVSSDLFSNFEPDHITGDPSMTEVSQSSSTSSSRSQDNDIWSEDVEQAFEEVLNIIPKNGLNKIKISGRSCGRNELISDYIFTKTGKFRTRKQVSSHIQVIKNLGQKLHIIKLINEGPVFETDEEQQECNKKFEEIFSKINLNKSLGFNESVSMSGIKRKNPSMMSTSGINKRPRRKSGRQTIQNTSHHISFQGFFMSIDDTFSASPTPYILTVQDSNQEVKKLVIKENANITNRFPGLDNFQNCNTIPIIHNMVKIHFSNLAGNYSIDGGFRSNFLLRWDDLEESSKLYSTFTCIYSFGKEVLKFTEEGFKFNENRAFLVKFWKFFLTKLIGKEENEANSAFKGMTIKQIVYESDSESESGETTESQNVVPVSKIKLVLLWEFGKVAEFKDAVTTTSKLILPSKIVSSNENIVPQVVDYSNGGVMASPYQNSTNQALSNRPVPYQVNYNLASAPISHDASSEATMLQTPGSGLDPNWAKAQERKFHSLQQMQTQVPTQQQMQQHYGQYPFHTPVSAMVPQSNIYTHQIVQQHPQSQQAGALPQGVQHYPTQGQPHPGVNLDLGVLPDGNTEGHEYQLTSSYPEQGFYQ